MPFLPWLLLLLPLASAAVIQLRLKRTPALAAYVSVASVLATFVITLALLHTEDASYAFTWATAGDFHITIGLTLDELSRGMMLIVTGVGSLVHIFSLGYMKDDEAKARYFAGLSIFMFSMTGIVLADNFLMMFMFWELVGFSSYLLIGHWFQKDSAADAAKKAFLTNRVGDFGFLIGILMLWTITGAVSFSGMAEAVQGGLPLAGTAVMGIAILCVFCGAIGKSAQVPLHVWLPDAMEGPTPVSALIHAATMVAAGVYMMARLFFSLTPPEGTEFSAIVPAFSTTTIAWIGGITSLLAALMATQQDDIKKILAYSTLSQLGYMIMAVGLLSPESGMFHLYTHAWFKALLFLGSGALIYACHHEQDIWKMGGLALKMPLTTLTFAIGTGALIAIPYVTSGFYSKEEILIAALDHGHVTPLFCVAAFVALLTAFYMTRAFVVTFFGKARDHGAEEAKEVGPVMLFPLLILAVLSVIAGFKFEGFDVPALLSAIDPRAHGAHHEGAKLAVTVSLAALAGGVALGFLLYAGRSKDPLAGLPPLKVFRNKFYFDELYAGLVKVLQDTVAAVVHFFDEFLINGLLVGGLSRTAGGIGTLFRRLQNGNLQTYSLLFGGGILVVIYLTVFMR